MFKRNQTKQQNNNLGVAPADPHPILHHVWGAPDSSYISFYGTIH